VTPSSESLALIKWSKPGIIYVARNRVNGKMYVGKTTKSIRERRKSHKDSALGKISKLPFHEAIRKYGIDGFDWKMVQKCHDLQTLDTAEKWWIRSLNTLVHDGYNCATGGSGQASNSQILARLGKVKRNRPPISEETRRKLSIAHSNRRHSDETKKKMSAWQIGRKRPEVSAVMKGRVFSEETRRKLSEAQKKSMTPERRELLASKNRGKKQSPEQYAKTIENLKKYRRKSAANKRKTGEANRATWARKKLSGKNGQISLNFD
jgi:group I intron endonuclease